MFIVMAPMIFSCHFKLWRAKGCLAQTSSRLGAVFCPLVVSTEFCVLSFFELVAVSDHFIAWIVPTHDLKQVK